MIQDIQGQSDKRGLPLELVGITKIKLPIQVSLEKNITQSVVASADFLTDLEHDKKGTHMSRFVEVLYKLSHTHLTLETIKEFTQEVKDKLQATNAYLSLTFPYFIEKEAPVSKNKGILDYTCQLITELRSNEIAQTLVLQVPVMLLCPCSKAISKYNAHNQRSLVTVTVELNEEISVVMLGSLVEKEASCELYPMLKRPDEKFVTEKSYENAKFVEDLVRDVALKLVGDKRIKSFLVECESYESIHNHNAYAKISSKNVKK